MKERGEGSERRREINIEWVKMLTRLLGMHFCDHSMFDGLLEEVLLLICCICMMFWL